VIASARDVDNEEIFIELQQSQIEAFGITGEYHSPGCQASGRGRINTHKGATIKFGSANPPEEYQQSAHQPNMTSDQFRRKYSLHSAGL
jgi:hypothetical protein